MVSSTDSENGFRHVVIACIVLVVFLILLANLSSFGGNDIVYIDRETLYNALIILILLLILTLLRGESGGGISHSGTTWGGGGDRKSPEEEKITFDLHVANGTIPPGGTTLVTAKAIIHKRGRSELMQGERVVFRIAGAGTFPGNANMVTVNTGTHGCAEVDFTGPNVEETDRISAELERNR